MDGAALALLPALPVDGIISTMGLPIDLPQLSSGASARSADFAVVAEQPIHPARYGSFRSSHIGIPVRFKKSISICVHHVLLCWWSGQCKCV